MMGLLQPIKYFDTKRNFYQSIFPFGLFIYLIRDNSFKIPSTAPFFKPILFSLGLYFIRTVRLLNDIIDTNSYETPNSHPSGQNHFFHCHHHYHHYHHYHHHFLSSSLFYPPCHVGWTYEEFYVPSTFHPPIHHQ
mmetsp:Transcript_4373/g.6152  ORF Transcript_4373/g.6152 Transcript_4373/m.6152 type:complete len:135 (+) Transcript_4373:24-428(+)